MAMTDEDLIEEAGRRLAAAAPNADIILFGSRARGEGRPDSDLDLLVIEPDFARRGEEYARLRKALRGLGVRPSNVVQLGEPSPGRPVAEGAVRSSPVIELEPAG